MYANYVNIYAMMVHKKKLETIYYESKTEG